MDQKTLKQILDYDSATGLFRWKVAHPPHGRIGQTAGNDNRSGYWKISIGGRRYYAHRLAFLWMVGKIPTEVDHMNRDRRDNRWCNLRAADRTLNCNNYANGNSSMGVRQRYGRWYARHAGTHIGVFHTKRDAVAAYRAIKKSAGLCIGPHPKKIAFPASKKQRAFRYKGKSLSEWARTVGLGQSMLHNRIFRQHWDIERALKTPPTPRHLRRLVNQGTTKLLVWGDLG